MDNTIKMFRLKGCIQHYDWGGFSFLPALLKFPNPDKKPFAEYWLGAHVKSPAMVVLENGATQDLDAFIRQDPEKYLGEEASKKFGRLPYLLKVLDVRDMLSIQVHPSKEAAEQKFEKENNRSISLDAPHRNYKDDNHKPELLSPLSDMYLLHGFKSSLLLNRILKETPELNFLQNDFKNDNYRNLYSRVMTMPQEEVNERLQPLLSRIITQYHAGKLTKADPFFWAARAALTFNKNGNIDRGIYSIFFFNLIKLTPGQALFQDAGMPHAYLEGHTIEVMANSDNVLRGGLTPKHIDVKELMEHIHFVATVPDIINNHTALHRESAAATENDLPEQIFPSPAPDFQLSRIQLKNGSQYLIGAKTADIYFIYEGEIIAADNGREFLLTGGEALLSLPGNALHLTAAKDAVIFRATTP